MFNRFAPKIRFAARLLLQWQLLPWFIGISVLAPTLMIWQALIDQEQKHIHQTVSLEANNLRYEVQEEIEGTVLALERMANRWEQGGQPPKSYWEADAGAYIKHFKTMQAIEWADPSLHVRWVLPLEGNEAVQNLDLTFEPRRQVALELARKERRTVMTRTLSLVQGEPGFIIYTPIFHQDQFEGFIIGVFRTQQIFDYLFSEIERNIEAAYAVTIYDGSTIIYARHQDLIPNSHSSNVNRQTIPVQAQNITWQVQITPTPTLINSIRSPLPQIVLTSGLLLAALLMLIARLAQMAQAKNRVIWSTNQQLINEINEREMFQAALLEKEQLWHFIFDQAAMGIVASTLDGQFVMANPKYCELTGYSLQELLKKQFQDITHPDDLEEDLHRLNALLKGELKFQSFVKRYIHKDQSIFWAEVNISLIKTLDHSADYVLAIVENITQRKQAEEDIYRALKQEQELNQLKAQIITTTSHEFRTPLAIILASAGVLAEYGNQLDSDKKQKHWQRIQQSVQYMTGLLENILVAEQAELGKLRFKPTVLNLETFCHNLIQEIEQDNRITFSVTCDENEHSSFAHTKQYLNLDVTLLRQILTNLLSNALKYSPPKSLVDFKLSYQPGSVTFQVQDHGIGIPTEALDQIFTLFYRAKNIGTARGTGLGLSIVKKCVELHGGTIAVTSELGSGTCFTVHIPYKE